MALKRIRKELDCNSNHPLPDISLGQDLRYPGDMYRLLAAVVGPVNTPYEDCLFFLSIHLPQDYPFKSPNVLFLTPIYHPNIDRRGYNCLDIFDHQWSPALTIPRVLLSLRSLLEDPNPDDPLEADIAKLYKQNPAEFRRIAREKAHLHAW